jgi:hypothetical protein
MKDETRIDLLAEAEKLTTVVELFLKFEMYNEALRALKLQRAIEEMSELEENLNERTKAIELEMAALGKHVAALKAAIKESNK